jgi:hypothetical protein
VDYVGGRLVTAVLSKLPTWVTLPAIHLATPEPEVYHVTLENFTTNVTDEGSIKFEIDQFNQGIRFEVSNIKLSILFDWSYHGGFPHLSDHGWGVGLNTLTLSGTAGFDFNRTGNGKLGASLTNFVNDLNVDSIKFEGGHYQPLQSLVNLLTSAVSPVVSSALSSAITTVISSLINEVVDGLLQKLNTEATFPIPLPVPFNIAQVQMGLTGLLTGPNYIGLQTTGAVQYKAEGAPACPLPVPPLPPTELATFDSSMLASSWNTYLLNTAWWTYSTAGLLKLVITPSMVPASFPLKLSTHSFCHPIQLIPEMCRQYPDNQMQIVIDLAPTPNASSQPIFHFSNNLITTVIRSTTTLEILLDNDIGGGVVHAFAIAGVVHIEGTVSIVDYAAGNTTDSAQYVLFGLRDLTVDHLELEYTNIGPLPALDPDANGDGRGGVLPLVTAWVNSISATTFVPSINRTLWQAQIPLVLPLSSSGLGFAHTNITMTKDIVFISADLAAGVQKGPGPPAPRTAPPTMAPTTFPTAPLPDDPHYLATMMSIRSAVVLAGSTAFVLLAILLVVNRRQRRRRTHLDTLATGIAGHSIPFLGADSAELRDPVSLAMVRGGDGVMSIASDMDSEPDMCASCGPSPYPSLCFHRKLPTLRYVVVALTIVNCAAYLVTTTMVLANVTVGVGESGIDQTLSAQLNALLGQVPGLGDELHMTFALFVSKLAQAEMWTLLASLVASTFIWPYIKMSWVVLAWMFPLSNPHAGHDPATVEYIILMANALGKITLLIVPVAVCLATALHVVVHPTLSIDLDWLMPGGGGDSRGRVPNALGQQRQVAIDVPVHLELDMVVAPGGLMWVTCAVFSQCVSMLVQYAHYFAHKSERKSGVKSSGGETSVRSNCVRIAGNSHEGVTDGNPAPLPAGFDGQAGGDTGFDLDELSEISGGSSSMVTETSAGPVDADAKLCLFSHYCADGRGTKIAAVSTLVVIAVSLCLQVGGIVSDSVEYEYDGIVGVLLEDTPGQTRTKTLALAQFSDFEWAGSSILEVFLIAAAGILPLLHCVYMAACWLVPLSRRQHNQSFIIGCAINSLCLLDISVVAVGACFPHLGAFVNVLVSDQCAPAAAVLQTHPALADALFAGQIPGFAAGGVYADSSRNICFQVDARLLRGYWLLLASVLLHWVAHFLTVRASRQVWLAECTDYEHWHWRAAKRGGVHLSERTYWYCGPRSMCVWPFFMPICLCPIDVRQATGGIQ